MEEILHQLIGSLSHYWQGFIYFFHQQYIQIFQLADSGSRQPPDRWVPYGFRTWAFNLQEAGLVQIMKHLISVKDPWTNTNGFSIQTL